MNPVSTHIVEMPGLQLYLDNAESSNGMKSILFSSIATLIVVLVPATHALCQCEKPVSHDCCGNHEKEQQTDCESLLQFCYRSFGENTLDIIAVEQSGDVAVPLPAVPRLPESNFFGPSTALNWASPELTDLHEPFLPRGPPSRTT